MMGQGIPKATASRLGGQVIAVLGSPDQEGFSGQAGKATWEGMLVYPFRAKIAEQLQ